MDQAAKNEFKQTLYEQFARIGKAMGNPRRLELLDLLAQTEHTVESLAHKTGMSIANVSQHLKTLRTARLVAVRREGTYAYYRLADENVLRVWAALNALARSHLVEINHLMEHFFEERAILPAMKAEELAKQIEQKERLILLDARPADEYAAAHIPGARSAPLETLPQLLTTLDYDESMVVYCRSAYCLLSDELALALHQRGYKVQLLAQGMTEWQLAGLPIETST